MALKWEESFHAWWLCVGENLFIYLFSTPNGWSSGRAWGHRLFFFFSSQIAWIIVQTAALVCVLNLDSQWICNIWHCHHTVKSLKSNTFHVPYLCVSGLCLNKQEQEWLSVECLTVSSKQKNWVNICCVCFIRCQRKLYPSHPHLWRDGWGKPYCSVFLPWLVELLLQYF